MMVGGSTEGRPRRKRRTKQLAFAFRSWGGARKGAGRKPRGERAGVPHLERERITRHTPVFVTLRLRAGLPNLRSSKWFGVVHSALSGGSARLGVRVVHYSVQGNHLHLVVEAESTQALARGIQGLSIRIARRLNRELGRRGRVFADRYHARALRSPLAVRRALVYVLNNARKHEAQRGKVGKPSGWVDSRSSGYVFDGWRGVRFEFEFVSDAAAQPARSWLLQRGWRRHGLIAPGELPSAGAVVQLARASPRGDR